MQSDAIILLAMNGRQACLSLGSGSLPKNQIHAWDPLVLAPVAPQKMPMEAALEGRYFSRLRVW
jgi:hypothetical protein